MQTDSAYYYLEAGARTRRVLKRLNVLVFHSLLPRSVTPSVPCSERHEVARIMHEGERQGACVDSVLHSPTGTDLVVSSVLLRSDDLPRAQAGTG